MSDDTKQEGCGECDSCIAGYDANYCTTQNKNKTNEMPPHHNNGDTPIET